MDMTQQDIREASPPQCVEGFDQLKSDLPEAQWIVLHTRSRQEKTVDNGLHAIGAGHFLPLAEQIRYYGRRKIAVRLPLFPGYVFMHGRRDQAYELDRQKRIAAILPVQDQQQLDSDLRNIFLALQQGAPLDPHPMLQAGMRAEVRSGPFRGIRGVVESRGRADRFVLQVECLNQALSLEIDASLLDVLD
jgi:transcription antitermination factor NusG